MSKFVIQKHIKADDTHWDLMLQAGSVLQTWRLDRPPKKLQGQTITAIKIFDHPLKFLTYEGTVNDGQGQVEIADSGTCHIIKRSETKIEFELHGKILKGNFILELVADNGWQLSYLLSGSI